VELKSEPRAFRVFYGRSQRQAFYRLEAGANFAHFVSNEGDPFHDGFDDILAAYPHGEVGSTAENLAVHEPVQIEDKAAVVLGEVYSSQSRQTILWVLSDFEHQVYHRLRSTSLHMFLL